MGERNAAQGKGFGPYTVLDLHELPDDGKGFELEDGWLIEVAASARHNWVMRTLARLLDAAVSDAGADVLVLDGGEWEMSTPAGIRKLDVFVVPREVARAAIVDESPKVIPGCEVLLVVEVISPGSGSERTDRMRKVADYAATGIPQYWIIEHTPTLLVHRLALHGDTYTPTAPPTGAGSLVTAEIEADKPLPVTFDPAVLMDF
ncbi:Uma2 family endonuclease [Actinocorallia aurantiaca]|uniref:Putative restriction endonuclease domain-containing protein n=1 Tax=Actinocorallia aurantiaca TaxID=46204 RepID=A0ABP6GCZ6_9ACTN